MSHENKIVLTGKNVDSIAFREALKKVLQVEFEDPKISYRLGYIARVVDNFTKELLVSHRTIVEQFSMVDEEGNKILEIPKEKKEEYIKALEPLHAKEYIIDKEKIDAKYLEGVKLTPNDISALKPILCGLE